MSLQNHDTPYRDEAASRHARSQDSTSRSPRKHSSRRGSRPAKDQRKQVEALPARSNGRKPAAQAGAVAKSKTSRRRSRRGGGGSGSATHQLTSVPTSRNAYMETRVWLLEQHGPVCAYCGVRFTARVMTLDHVAPRRGLTAYDRRDNLVLACPGCNAAKADKPPLAYLLGARSRAVNLLRYGAHLSPMLLDLAMSLVPEGETVEPTRPASTNGNGNGNGKGDGWVALDWDDGDSPYRD